ncbi:hypothetical protein FJT64_017987 [Amphibalanus amphitrite]|uniref:Uncharacterized protein n=1 Tax=Amphibalanus amphitrite TaxID=1232801 RepID=A0A6A4WVJ0_AMPAM|nr:hypothetical protein FJT64_017987 [Amphibalanus amphitrite]
MKVDFLLALLVLTPPASSLGGKSEYQESDKSRANAASRSSSLLAAARRRRCLRIGRNGSVTRKGDNGVVGELVAQDQDGNVAAGLAELQLPDQGVTGPVYELVGAGIKIPQPTAVPKSSLKSGKNSSAVGEVTVNIQHTNQQKHPKKKVRHWCDLSGVWINDEGSLLLTLGFPSSDQTLLTGYLSQVSVDMTPTEEAGWKRRRKRRHARHSHHHKRRRRRRQRHRRDIGIGLGSSRHDSQPPPHFPPPPAGTSGIPSSLTNRTVLQGSAVTRAGPFTVVTRHGGGAVGSMVGQCQVCGGLDTIVAQFISVSEVFACIDALWSHKSVHFMFRKWGERHRRRHHHRPQLLETEVVIKQRDRSRTPPPPPPPETETVEIEEEVVEKVIKR